MLDSKLSFLLGVAVPTLAFCVTKLGRQRSGTAETRSGCAEKEDDRGAAPAGPGGGLSCMGESILSGMKSMYVVGWKETMENAYDAETNPSGCIQLGLAENMVSFDLVEDWYAAKRGVGGRGESTEVPTEDSMAEQAREEGSTLVASEAIDVFAKGSLNEIGGYQDYSGRTDFRAALAKWMGVVYEGRVTFDPDKLITAVGCGSVVEMLAFCLADPGDAILVPAPMYSGFVLDVEWRTGVKLVTADCDPETDFAITYKALDGGFRKAESAGQRVRAILIASPCNPTGVTYDRATLCEVVRFARDRHLHVISDEIFAACVFGPPAFVSILEVLDSDEDREKVHVVYGLSKDLGLAGFRVGAVYTRNERLSAAASSMARFISIPSDTQKLLIPLLTDKRFAKRYLTSHQERLRAKQETVFSYLDKAKSAGVRYVTGNAGVYVWIDMRSLLPMEEDAAKAEDFLFLRLLYEVGININGGLACGMKDPGWFRLCFAMVGDLELRVGLQRLVDFVAQCYKEKSREV